MTTVYALKQQLLETIIPRDNLQRAWNRVKVKKGMAGVDAMTVADSPAWRSKGQTR